MSTPLFFPNDYLAYIKISNKKKLLVEGPDDNRLFNKILDIYDHKRDFVDIDNAAIIRSLTTCLSNREKVEAICRQTLSTDFSDKLVGFVDREFRGFEINEHLQDKIGNHFVDGRLIWSRGHSVENYYFDFEILRSTFFSSSTTPYYSGASDLFKDHFIEIVCFACAASLVGEEIGNYQIIRNNIIWNMFEFAEERFQINMDIFIDNLRTKNVAENLINVIETRLPYWENKIKNSDFETIRWMCHGHIGFSFIWAAFKMCVYEFSIQKGCSNPNVEVEHAIMVRDEIRFNLCAQKWIEKSPKSLTDFPFIVLNLLGLLNN